jgi:CheY-like chemotaxis protein
MRILVAEDDMIPRWVLERTLAKWGYEVVSSQNGPDAWKNTAV